MPKLGIFDKFTCVESVGHGTLGTEGQWDTLVVTLGVNALASRVGF